jgi:DNA mismatch repair protein MutL
MTIKILDSKVISQIAAGEVVERPASVVKELVENALDAKANQITVEIKDGGIVLMRVTDNGTGIADGQIEMAFERHATSKISSLDDLQSLGTLGFRGEALPSIASVARVEILSSDREDGGAAYLELEEGRVLKHENQARSPGTTITVHNLFRHIPARLKFLKSASAESGRIADIVTRYALAYPEVKFNYINENKTVLRTAGSGKLIDSVIAVYGIENASQMLEVKSQERIFENNGHQIKIYGLVGSPQISRATRDYLSFFVNRRWVNNRMLGFAVEEAYHGLLMQGKHPLTVINLEIPADQIDVNVHPAKTEIKFQNERAVFAALQRSVRSVLVGSSPVPQVNELRSDFRTPANSISTIGKTFYAPVPSSPPVGERLDVGQSVPTPLMSLPLLRVLGQLARNYIVAEGPDGLYLIDQHAAHERIMLEKIRRQKASHAVEVQGLLEPATLELDPRQAVTLGSHLEDLSKLGFSIENFGESTFLVRAIPAVISQREWSVMLKESLDTFSGDWSENLLNRLACHSAIRAGQVLNEDEMRELIRQLEGVDLPNSCPHGRPTMIRLTQAQIEKEFGRI